MSGWRQVDLGTRAEGLRASPYYEWTRATQFRYYDDDAQWLPVLLRLRNTTAREFARLVFEMQEGHRTPENWAALLRVPRFYAMPSRRLREPTHFIALLARRRFLKDLYLGVAPGDQVASFELGASVEPSSGMSPPAGAQKKKGRPPEVVTGVIDDGIAFAHDRFLSADGTTRIEYFWDQLEPSSVWGTWLYGREMDKHHPVDGIDARRRDSMRGARVDEDLLYRLSGHVDHSQPGHKPLAQRLAHGTHVMDLAANARSRPQPGKRPIVAVQLPVSTTADTSGATLGPQIYNGLCYIIDRADAIALAAKCPQLPVVVNVSYGLIAGPHDGSSDLEAAIDELLESCNPVDAKGKPTRPPFRVVLPAGNSHLSRCHASFDVAAGGSRTLHWRVLPDDWTESHVEIWLPDKGSANVSITLTAPDGSATNAFAAGVVQAYDASPDVVVARAAYYPPGVAGGRALLWFAVARTGWPDGGVPLAPAGVWTITIDNGGTTEVSDIHAWIQRDDTPVGYKRAGRQSYFDDVDYARFDDGGRAIEDDAHSRTANSYVKREGTINAIATGRKPIVIASMRRSDWKPARYSASGPVANYPPGRGAPTPRGPDVMSVSDDTPSHYGVLAAGSRSGSCVPMYGTSVAAPQVARWIADELAKGNAGGRKEVAEYANKIVAPPLYTEKNPPPGAAPKPSGNRSGKGRIEFEGGRRERFERG